MAAILAQARSYSSFIVAALILVLFWTIAPKNAVHLAKLTPMLEEQQDTNQPPALTHSLKINHHVSHADVTTSDRVAVLIESRPLPNLVPIILHFSSVLGPTWPIIFYHSLKDDELLYNSPALSRAVASGALTIRKLPDDGTVKFDTHRSVSTFLVSSWLWERLAPAKHVLLFQTDSVLCANSPRHVDDFLNWDLIGAPIDSRYGSGYNGGLSLRNRELMLRIANERDQETEHPTFEDQWFYKEAKKLADAGEDVKLPGPDEAVKFSVETIWGEKPLGYHQVSRWQKDRMDVVKEWCPEIDMAIGGSLHPGHD